MGYLHPLNLEKSTLPAALCTQARDITVEKRSNVFPQSCNSIVGMANNRQLDTLHNHSEHSCHPVVHRSDRKPCDGGLDLTGRAILPAQSNLDFLPSFLPPSPTVSLSVSGKSSFSALILLRCRTLLPFHISLAPSASSSFASLSSKILKWPLCPLRSSSSRPTQLAHLASIHISHPSIPPSPRLSQAIQSQRTPARCAFSFTLYPSSAFGLLAPKAPISPQHPPSPFLAAPSTPPQPPPPCALPPLCSSPNSPRTW